MQQDNLYETVRFSWATAASRGQTETDLAVVAVIDGHHIKVTSFRQAVVPPPMSAYEIHLGCQVESVLFPAAAVSAAAAAASAANPGLLSKACQDSNNLLVVTHSHVRIFSLDASSAGMGNSDGNVRVDITGAGGTGYAPQTAHHRLAGSLQLRAKEEGRLTNWVWCGDRLLASLASHSSSSAVLVFEVRERLTS
jgi:elongator complex protein 1